MKKISIMSIICVLLILAFSLTAGAVTLDDVRVVDTPNAKVRISGNTGVLDKVLTTSVFLIEGTELDDTNFETVTKKYTDVLNADSEGKFEKTFSVNGMDSSNTLKLFAVSEDGTKTDKNFKYYDADDVDVFLNNIATKTVNDLTEYQYSIGLNGNVFDVSAVAGYETMLLDNLKSASISSTMTLEQKLTRFFDAYNTSKLQAEFLGILKSGTSSDISNALNNSKYSSILASADLANYNNSSKVTNAEKSEILKAIKKSYTDMNSFLVEFNRLVTEYANNGQTGGGNGGGPGGGSGIGGGTNERDVTPIIDKNDDKTSKYFDDLKNVSWAVDAINALAEKKIVAGVGDRMFEPDATLTREAFAKMIVLATEMYDSSAKPAFNDANSGEWYDSYIASAKNSGFVSGISETEFGVGMNISRQDLAVMLYRATKAKGKVFTQKKTFADDYQIADYAKEAVSYLAGEGMISGMGDNLFAPNENATRAQAAKLIYSLIGGNK